MSSTKFYTTMTKPRIGLILKDLRDEKNLSMAHIANVLGKSRQSVNNDFNRSNMNDDEITLWASALGVAKHEIYDRWKDVNETSSNKLDGWKYGESAIQELREVFAEQLSVKDRQIEKLQEMVIQLLGKSDSVSSIGFGATTFMIIAPNLGTLVNRGNDIFFGVYLQ